MRVPTIKDVMHEPCVFTRYEDGKLWYQISYAYRGTTDLMYHGSFDFPVPVNDVGGGSLGLSEKAVTLMRWIRKHIEYLNKAIAE